MQQKINRHPVDRLADIRDQIRRLKAEEEIIRQELIDGKCRKIGDQWIANIFVSEHDRLDTTLIRKHFGYEKIKPFLKKQITQTIRLTERVIDEETVK